jgi:hypothetical protein
VRHLRVFAPDLHHGCRRCTLEQRRCGDDRPVRPRNAILALRLSLARSGGRGRGGSSPEWGNGWMQVVGLTLAEGRARARAREREGVWARQRSGAG